MRGRVLCGAAVLAMLFAVPVAAQAEPVPGCGNGGWILDDVSGVVDATYPLLLNPPSIEEWDAVIAAADGNSDDHLCYTIGKANPGHGGAPHLVWRDNRTRGHVTS